MSWKLALGIEQKSIKNEVGKTGGIELLGLLRALEKAGRPQKNEVGKTGGIELLGLFCH